MHSLAFQRSVSWLACLAMLLMLLAPLVSRGMLACAPSTAHMQSMHAPAAPEAVAPAAMCTPAMAPTTAADPHHHGAHAMANADSVPPPMHVQAAPTPQHPAGRGEDGDCAYCAIAARLLVFAVALLAVLLVVPLIRDWLPQRLARVPRGPTGQLGARGPPCMA
ncbi:membrane protein [Xanthomonas maliensis]|uniref:membrane protein n=1 Tax=Xanthomonas maliensis TaxID=1321368 RepID=UPI00039DAC87|nr:membrane protein [Xanthomonas maliensis]KAB7771064.1 hypothetical protein CKY51_03610 [Xanthomonas maliensis]